MSNESNKILLKENSYKLSKRDSQIPTFSPTNFRRAGSLKLRNEIRKSHKMESSTSIAPLRRHSSLRELNSSPLLYRRLDRNKEKDDDLDSEKSFDSTCSSLCGHSPFAHNGTTFSARNMKYVFHCSTNAGSEEYLTPTQRANRTIKKLRHMLADAQSELIEKDNEISCLTKEIVELRMLSVKTDSEADLCDIIENSNYETSVVNCKKSPRYMDVLPEEHDNVSAVTTETGEQINLSTNRPLDSRGISPQHTHHSSSLADSGNFEDINCTIALTLEKDLEELRQNYDDLREKHNEKVEELLKIIADSNDKYYDLKPKYDTAVIKIKELEKEIEMLKNDVSRLEELKTTLYLQLYSKQNKSEQIISDAKNKIEYAEEKLEKTEETKDVLCDLAITKKELQNLKDSEFKNCPLLSANEAISLWILGTRKAMYRALLETSKRKNVNDAEMTLRFLKSAVFYLLTDTSNSKDHLAAIESILGYSEDEKIKIEKVQSWKY